MIRALLSFLRRYWFDLGLLLAVIGSTWLIWRGFDRRDRVQLEPLALGRNLLQPTQYIPVPSHGRFIVLEKRGVAGWFDREDPSRTGPVFDFSSRTYSAGHEEGLLGLALAPDFPQDPHAYVFYNVPDPVRSRLVRLKLDADLKFVPGSEEVLLEIDKVSKWHNGGMLLFDQNGYLLVAVGDSNITAKITRSEVEALLQDQSSLWGKILRLKVDPQVKEAYEIPADNPFVGQDGARPEIWAYGFRNPWRLSFDPPTGNVYAFDVGGGKYEEVNLIEPGKNYGWPIMEGAGCAHSSDHGRCNMDGKVKPLGAYRHHSQLNAITGGLFYRGQALPQLRDQILFASFQSGLFAFAPQVGSTNFRPTRLTKRKVSAPGLVDYPLTVASVDRDVDGEPIIVDYGGQIFKVKPNPVTAQLQSFVNSVWAF